MAHDGRGGFVPGDFAVPRELVTGEFRLEPLGPQHNTADYEAWTSSIDHIRATPGFQDVGGAPGFGDSTWPDPEMTPEENLADLRRHAEDFAPRCRGPRRQGWFVYYRPDLAGVRGALGLAEPAAVSP